MASNQRGQQHLVPIEEALDRRTNHHGMVEYLVKLHNEDKMEWVPWTNIYCPQLMDSQTDIAKQVAASTGPSATPSASGIFDI